MEKIFAFSEKPDWCETFSDMVNTGSINNTIIPMIRLGEMYLIAAESRSADIEAGVSYVNQLRAARGVSGLQTLSRNTLQYEYIRELYGEGQLFFMYKRMFSPILFTSSDNKNPQPADAIFVVPLPSSETDN